MTFTQDFTAVANSLGWTALVATVPILYFFWALAIKKMKGYMAGLTTLILAILVAVIAFKVPVITALASASQGLCTELYQLVGSLLLQYFYIT